MDGEDLQAQAKDASSSDDAFEFVVEKKDSSTLLTQNAAPCSGSRRRMIIAVHSVSLSTVSDMLSSYQAQS